MLTNYTIDIADSFFTDFARSPGFDLVAATPGTFAARIRIVKSEISDLSGTLVAAAAERGSSGLYSAEVIDLDQLKLRRVGKVSDVLRQGTDESTFGPNFMLTNSQITDSGALLLYGAQSAHVAGNTFVRSGGVSVTHTVGEPVTRISANVFTLTPLPSVTELHFSGPARADIRDNQVR